MANQMTTKTLSAEFINTFIKSKLLDRLNRIADWETYWNSIGNDDNGNCICIKLPFNKIDGVDVVVQFKLFEDGSFWIDITNTNVWIINEYGKISNDFTGNDISKYSYELIDEKSNVMRLTYINQNEGDENGYTIDLNDYYFVENPYFDNVDFVEEINRIVNLKWNSIMGFIDFEISLEDIELLGYDLDDCVVCYEKTNNKCKNKHYTCVDCVSKIYKQNRRIKVKCPLCRENM